MQHHERRTETRRKSRFRFLDSLFRAGNFRRVTGKEVIHRLFRRQSRNRRQNAKRIRRQHDDVARVTGAPLRHNVRDAGEWIRSARVFSLARVVQIDLPCYRIENDVLQNRAEHAGRAIDVGLGFCGQLDHLRVTAAFVVEYAVVGPPATMPPIRQTSENLGIEAVKAFLKTAGIAAESLRLDDGSGLSRSDMITAEATVQLLTFMNKHRYADVFRAALPIAGVDGTLRNRMRRTLAENNVRAKTGSLSSAASLGGYVTTAAGEKLAFAIIVNNYGNDVDPRATCIDPIAVLLAAFNAKADASATTTINGTKPPDKPNPEKK